MRRLRNLAGMLAFALLLSVQPVAADSANWQISLQSVEGPSGTFRIIAQGTNVTGQPLHSCSAKLTVNGAVQILTDDVVRIGDTAAGETVTAEFTVSVGDAGGSYVVNFEGFYQ